MEACPADCGAAEAPGTEVGEGFMRLGFDMTTVVIYSMVAQTKARKPLRRVGILDQGADPRPPCWGPATRQHSTRNTPHLPREGPVKPQPAKPPPTPDPAEAWRQTHVSKTLWPGRPGTRRHQRNYGKALVCVRYRLDPKGIIRFTTVELVVEQARINPRLVDDQTYGVETWAWEADVTSAIKRAQGRWDPESRLWELSGEAIKRLRLQHRTRKK